MHNHFYYTIKRMLQDNTMRFRAWTVEHHQQDDMAYYLFTPLLRPPADPDSMLTLSLIKIQFPEALEAGYYTCYADFTYNGKIHQLVMSLKQGEKRIQVFDENKKCFFPSFVLDSWQREVQNRLNSFMPSLVMEKLRLTHALRASEPSFKEALDAFAKDPKSADKADYRARVKERMRLLEDVGFLLDCSPIQTIRWLRCFYRRLKKPLAVSQHEMMIITLQKKITALQALDLVAFTAVERSAFLQHNSTLSEIKIEEFSLEELFAYRKLSGDMQRKGKALFQYYWLHDDFDNARALIPCMQSTENLSRQWSIQQKCESLNFLFHCWPALGADLKSVQPAQKMDLPADEQKGVEANEDDRLRCAVLANRPPAVVPTLEKALGDLTLHRPRFGQEVAHRPRNRMRWV